MRPGLNAGTTSSEKPSLTTSVVGCNPAGPVSLRWPSAYSFTFASACPRPGLGLYLVSLDVQHTVGAQYIFVEWRKALPFPISSIQELLYHWGCWPDDPSVCYPKPLAPAAQLLQPITGGRTETVSVPLRPSSEAGVHSVFQSATHLSCLLSQLEE